MDVLQNMQQQTRAELSNKRKICDETKVNEDEDPETVDKIIEKLKEGSCHGRDFNHMIFDYKVLQNVPLTSQEQFMLTDGGLLVRDVKR